MTDLTFGIILGNRDYFSDDLCKNGRQTLLKAIDDLDLDINTVILSKDEGILGTVMDNNSAEKNAKLFKEKRGEIDGVVVSLPNFGDEKSIAKTLRKSQLDVPVLVHAFPDEPDKLQLETRRDSFCGKISVCNNLTQYGIDFTLTEKHTLAPQSTEFSNELRKFAGVCRVVKSLRGAKIGEVGPRPADFNTVRYSEKILEKNGISVEPVVVSKLIRDARDIEDGSGEVEQRLSKIKSYVESENVPSEALKKIAKLDIALTSWVENKSIDALALQCWDTLQNEYGINPCTSMSMLSNSGLPAACETDVTGALSMLALQAASEKPSALMDWNNNYPEKDKAVVFHCSNFPADFCTTCQMNYANVLSTTLGKENTYGSLEGTIQPGYITFARLSTDDSSGRVRGYIVEGEVTNDKLETFGGRGVVKVPQLQDLMHKICSEGFEHHTAGTLSVVGDILEEAFSNYLKWQVYRHPSS